MTENNDRKQFNLKLVLKEIIQPKVPTIALVIFLNSVSYTHLTLPTNSLV